jgi:hypothetical protein
MVLKESKHGFNTGNTIRYHHVQRRRVQQGTSPVVTAAHTNRCWLEDCLDALYVDKDTQHCYLFGLLSRIAECDGHLFDSDTVSLKKRNRLEIWDELMRLVRDLLCLQQSSEVTTVSVAVFDGELIRNSLSPLAKDHPNYQEVLSVQAPSPNPGRGVQRRPKAGKVRRSRLESTPRDINTCVG